MTRKNQKHNNGGIDQRAVKALAHPIRMQVLTALGRRVASPSELAEELGEPLGNVSYHVRRLVDMGCIQLVRTAPRRGAVEHYYKAVERPLFSDLRWSAMPKALRQSFAGAALTQVWEDLEQAAEAGALEQEGLHLTQTMCELDEIAWDALSEELERVRERARKLEAESKKRLSKSGPGRKSAHLVLMLFEGTQPSSPQGRAKGRAKAASGKA